jgi:general secretion pathway protein D
MNLNMLVRFGPWCLCGIWVAAGCAMFDSPDARRGDQHLAAANWEEASLAYRQALKNDPFDFALQNKYAVARERSAATHEERARELLKLRQLDMAIEEFKRALTIEPGASDHQDGLTEALRLKEARDQYREAERLAQLGRASEALEHFTRAAELDPSLKEALEAVSRITEEQQALSRDDRRNQPVTLQFRNAGLKEVLEALGKAARINFVFDKDVRNDPFSVSLQDKPFDEALNLILNSNSLFAQRASSDLIIISPNTKQKQEQYQDLMIRTFYLSNAKAKDMLALLKTMLDAKHIHANEPLNTIVIRDQPEKVELAEKIILANDLEDSEVLFDVEILEVDRTVDQTYGLSYPKQVAAALVPPGFAAPLLENVVPQFTFRQLTNLGPDSYLFKLPTNVQLDFFKRVTDAKTLAAPKVRVVNNKKAEINIGDKQPILLSTTNVLPGQAATGAVPTTSTVTSIEFRDTGVKLTVEPAIHLGDELSLKMKVEVIRLGDQVILQANPPITQFKFGNRSAETMLNVRNGETIVLGGLLQEEDRRTKVTIPWLGDIPFLGNLISSFKTQRVTTEVILTLTPHIVQPMRPPGLQTQAFWSGTESVYATSPLFFSPGQRSSVPALPVSSAGLTAAVPGPVPASDVRVAEEALKLLPRLSVQPADAAVPVGKEIRIDVFAEKARGITGETMKLFFDPKVVAFREAAAGELIGGRHGKAALAVKSRSSDGEMELRFRRMSSPLRNEGQLVSLTFVAKAPGVSPVRVLLSGESGDRDAADPAGGRGIVRVR